MSKRSSALVSLLGLSLGLLSTPSASAFEFDKKLVAPDGARDDSFGNSVSLSGNTALISSPSDNDNETNSGSAYVFTGESTTTTTPEPSLILGLIGVGSLGVLARKYQ